MLGTGYSKSPGRRTITIGSFVGNIGFFMLVVWDLGQAETNQKLHSLYTTTIGVVEFAIENTAMPVPRCFGSRLVMVEGQHTESFPDYQDEKCLGGKKWIPSKIEVSRTPLPSGSLWLLVREQHQDSLHNTDHCTVQSICPLKPRGSHSLRAACRPLLWWPKCM